MTIDSSDVTRFVRQLGLVESRVARIRAEAGEPESASVLAGALMELETASEELQVAGEELRVQQEHLDDMIGVSGLADDLDEQLFEHLPVPLVVTTPQGVVLRASSAACDLLDRSRALLEGLPLVAAVPLDGRRVMRTALTRLAEPGGREAPELPVVRSDGVTVTVRFDGRPGRQSGEPVLRWLLSVAEDTPEDPEEDAAGDAAGDAAERTALAAHAARAAEVLSRARWHDLQAALVDLTSVSLTREPLEDVLQHVSRVAVRGIDGAQSVSLTLLEGRTKATLGMSGPMARQWDHQQYELGEGPCVDAMRLQARVSTNDLAADRRWPRFAPVAAGSGLSSVLSEPLVSDDRVIGSMNVYSSSPNAFGDEDHQVGAVFAQAASVVVQDAQTVAHHRRLVRELSEAMTSRASIDQARGIIMAQTGCTEQEAFDRLRTASQRENVKLRDVAQRLVDGARAHARRQLNRR